MLIAVTPSIGISNVGRRERKKTGVLFPGAHSGVIRAFQIRIEDL